MFILYAAPACGGFSLVCAEKMQQKLWAVDTMLPSILMMLFTNTKAVVIGAAILWISAYLVSYYLKYSHAPVVRLKIIVLVLTLRQYLLGSTCVLLQRVGYLCRDEGLEHPADH